MASAAEQLAANLNFGALAKSEDLKSRIWFTLGALIVYRLGTYIPIPGIDTVELARFAAWPDRPTAVACTPNCSIWPVMPASARTSPRKRGRR